MAGDTNQDHRVAVVIAGAGGIGGAIVARLAPGHTGVVVDRAGDVIVNLADPDDVRRAARDVLARYGRCEVFVHAAATFAFGPLEQVELDTWRHIQAVNLTSALLLTQAFAPGMQKLRFGRVIFIVPNSPPDGLTLPYVASKGALIGTARTFAGRLGADGIAATAVARSYSLPRHRRLGGRVRRHRGAHGAAPSAHTRRYRGGRGHARRDEPEALTGQTPTACGALVMR